MDRRCAECGAVVEADEDFCGECGSYLEWDDTVIEEVETPSEQTPDPPAPSGSPASSGPSGPSGPGPATDDAPERAAPVGTVPPAAFSPVAQSPAAPSSSTPAQPVAPVGLRRPQAAPATPRRATREAVPEEPLRPGDLICGQCGVGNAPTRKFCRRCGHDLREAVVVRAPWWRRLLPRRRARAAGDRPRSRRRLRLPGGRLVPLLAVLGLLAAAGFALRGPATEAVAELLDRVMEPEGIEAAEVTASSSAAGHPPGALTDTDPTVFWAPGGGPRGESVTATFSEPQRLVSLLISPGASVSRKAQWVEVGRPRTLRVELHREGAPDERTTVELPDEMGTVPVELGTSGVTAVTLRIQRVHRGRSQQLTAIGEVEFFVRR